MALLEVQKYLKEHDLEALEKEFSIRVTRSDTDSRVILNYNQIESPKLHPIVRECRGLVIDSRDNSIVAKAFNRFFNYGEVKELDEKFDFSNFTAYEKIDGSLIIIYFWEGKWRVNTRGSFGGQPINSLVDPTLTWESVFLNKYIWHLQCLDKDTPKAESLLNPKRVYVCEYTSPLNKVVRDYDTESLTLLAILDTDTWQEIPIPSSNIHPYGEEVDIAAFDGVAPTIYGLTDIDKVLAYIRKKENIDPTWEGVVLVDKNFNRIKVKSDSYVKLHHLKGNGDNLYNPKHQLRFILRGEVSEILTHFPEAMQSVLDHTNTVHREFGILVGMWELAKNIKSQKEFALLINSGCSKLAGLLFQLRKEVGPSAGHDDIWRLLSKNEDLLYKKVFKENK